MPPTFSFSILFTLLGILAVSGRVFYVLNRQWTTHRPTEALRDWAQDRKYKLRLSPDAIVPASLEGLTSLDPQVRATLQRGLTTLVQITTLARPTSPRSVWNLLIHETQQAHNPAGLRPVASAVSFLDLFSLNGFPSLLPPERFVVFAGEARDAKKIAASSARGLLPADIGLLVHGPYLTLDFSSRPFDAIEFERMLAIMDQIRQTL